MSDIQQFVEADIKLIGEIMRAYYGTEYTDDMPDQGTARDALYELFDASATMRIRVELPNLGDLNIYAECDYDGRAISNAVVIGHSGSESVTIEADDEVREFLLFRAERLTR